MRKLLSIALSLIFAFPSYGGHVVRQRVVNEVVVSQKVIKFDDFSTLRVIAIPVTSYGPEYHYESLGIRGRRLSQEDVDAITDSIMKELDKRIEVVDEAGEQPAVPTPPTADPQPQPAPTPETSPTSSLTEQVLQLFENKCYQCHANGSTKGNLKLINDDGTMGSLTDRQVAKILRRTTGGFGLNSKQIMPLNSDRLSDQEIELLQQWADARFETE